MSEPQYIFTMHRLDKVHPPDKVILKDVSLSFLYGAKIGVLGVNGAGKSTLLRIMAGTEPTSSGVAQLAPGARVGLLEQEPTLDPDLDVRGNIEQGLADQLALTARYAEIGAKLAEPMEPDQMQELLDEFQRVQDEIERVNAWDIDRKVEVAMDALRVPPGDADVATLSGGRAAARGARAAAAVGTGSAAARRADQPPRRRVGRLAGAVPGGVRRAPSSR